MTRLALDIDVVSTKARAEKSARSGHISTLGFWFARRPTGLSRALIVAAGTDTEKVSEDAALMAALKEAFPMASNAWTAIRALTSALAEWGAYSDTPLMTLAARCLEVSNVRRVVDPFGGGGSIPLEASRLGLEVGTGDLNPAAVVLLRSMLQVLPAASPAVLEALKATVAEASKLDLDRFHPSAEPFGDVSAILWAWRLDCPSCGDRFPLISNPGLSKARGLAVKLKRFDSVEWLAEITNGTGSTTASGGKATCPHCGNVTSSSQLMAAKSNGRMDEIPYALVTVRDGQRTFLTDPSILSTLKDVEAPPTELGEFLRLELDRAGIRHLWAMAYGLEAVQDLFSARQIQELDAALRALRDNARHQAEHLSSVDREALFALVAFVAVRLSLYNSRHSWWQPNGEFPAQTFVRQGIGVVWNYCEVPPSSRFAGGMESATAWVTKAARPLIGKDPRRAVDVWCGPADQQPLATNSVDLIVTDPPYFDSITYAYLSDVFYPFYRFMLSGVEGWDELVSARSAPREVEAIVDRTHSSLKNPKNSGHFQRVMTASFRECHRVLKVGAPMVVMYGHKDDEAWRAMLTALAAANFLVEDAIELTSERGAKFRHVHVDHLAQSVALICRASASEAEPASPQDVRSMVEGNVGGGA